MPTALALRPKTAAPDLADYSVLLKYVRQIFEIGQQQAAGALLWTQWNTGWFIQQHILQKKSRAPYGRKVVLNLARDVEKSNTVIKRCRQIYRSLPKFFPDPIGPRGGQSFATQDLIKSYPLSTPLSINQVELLITVRDSTTRHQLLDQAVRRKWSVRELEKRVRAVNQKSKNGKKKIKVGAHGRAPLLVPKKGKIGIFQIVEKYGKLHLDRGFTSYRELTTAEAKQFKDQDFVRIAAGGKIVKAESGTTTADLYTYEADLVKVIDADTHWLVIWLKRPDWLEEKIRLRGIDAFELRTRKGRAAKRFVEKLMKRAVKIVVTSTKPDKWDRYLTDLFLTLPDGQEIFLNNLLLEKGHAVLKTDWSLDDWEKG